MTAEEYIAKTVASAPPLTPVQREVLIAAFAGFTQTVRDK